MPDGHRSWSGSDARGRSPTFRFRPIYLGRKYYSYLSHRLTQLDSQMLDTHTHTATWLRLREVSVVSVYHCVRPNHVGRLVGRFVLLTLRAVESRGQDETSVVVSLSIRELQNKTLYTGHVASLMIGRLYIGSPLRVKRLNRPMSQPTCVGQQGEVVREHDVAIQGSKVESSCVPCHVGLAGPERTVVV